MAAIAEGVDADGQALHVTVRAVADELAAAAELVKGKADGVPAALVRGAGHLVMLEHPSVVTARLERLLERVGTQRVPSADEVVVPVPGPRTRRRRR